DDVFVTRCGATNKIVAGTDDRNARAVTQRTDPIGGRSDVVALYAIAGSEWASDCCAARKSKVDVADLNLDSSPFARRDDVARCGVASSDQIVGRVQDVHAAAHSSRIWPVAQSGRSSGVGANEVAFN